MASSRVRPAPHLLIIVAGIVLAVPGAVLAGKNDLALLNLCPSPPAPAGQITECQWVRRNGAGQVTGVSVDDAAKTSFRSLMSELGVVIAPRLQTPADTLGYAGFQFSAELGITRVSADRPYWNAVEGDPASPSPHKPDSHLTTVGGYVRKGMWFPIPAVELGAGATSVLGSRMYSLQGYVKVALQEGFHGWPIPSVAVRAGASQLLGTDQVDLTVYSFDVLASKAFSLAGTARIEPFVGWNILFIDAQSGVIDATPACDAYALKQTPMGATPPSSSCSAADSGTFNDLNANFTFPRQDVITRQRWFGGLKLKLSVLFLVGEYDYVRAGTSHDEREAPGARDTSAAQQTFSLSAGFDF